MMRFRDHMRTGRQRLHDVMSVPAVWFMHPFVEGVTEPSDSVDVRVHDRWLTVGDLKGTSVHYAEVQEDAPRIIFMRSILEPQRKMVISVAPGVAYLVQNVMPPNDITVTANVSRIPVEDTAGFPVPESP